MAKGIVNSTHMAFNGTRSTHPKVGRDQIIAEIARSLFDRPRLKLCAALLVLVLSTAAKPAHAASFFEPLDSPSVDWQISDGWTNGDPFNVGWRADHVEFPLNGYMNLKLDDVSCPVDCSGRPYASGEYQSNNLYGYGSFGTRMKVAPGDGLITSFFTFTGTYSQPGHDEIDIEILGRNTWKMQVNYFVDGVGGHEHVINLGFDASADYHDYGFKWSPGKIEWYVDGSRVYTVRASDIDGDGIIEDTNGDGLVDEGMPTRAGKIMVNLWAATGVDSWSKQFNYVPGTTIEASYDWIQFVEMP